MLQKNESHGQGKKYFYTQRPFSLLSQYSSVDTFLKIYKRCLQETCSFLKVEKHRSEQPAKIFITMSIFLQEILSDQNRRKPTLLTSSSLH